MLRPSPFVARLYICDLMLMEDGLQNKLRRTRRNCNTGRCALNDYQVNMLAKNACTWAAELGSIQNILQF